MRHIRSHDVHMARRQCSAALLRGVNSSCYIQGPNPLHGTFTLCSRRFCNDTDRQLTAAIKACRKSREWQRALRLLLGAQEQQRSPSVFAYTVAMGVCGRSSQWHAVISALELMRQCGVRPDAVAFSVAARAVAAGGEWQKAITMLDSMSERRSESEVVSHDGLDIEMCKVTLADNEQADRQWQAWTARNQRRLFDLRLEKLRLPMSMAQVLQGKEAKRAWLTWSRQQLLELRKLMEAQVVVDAKAATELERGLGVAANEGVMACFSHPGARAGYLVRHLVSRCQFVADAMLCSKASWLVDALENSLFGSQPCNVVSLGGGPGYDFASVVLLGAFFASPSRTPVAVHARILDYQAGWTDCASAIGEAVRTKFGPQHRSVSGRVDIRKPLLHPANVDLSSILDTADIIIASYVVCENVQALRISQYVFFEQLFERVKPGTVFIFTDTTHRPWPELLEAACRGTSHAKSVEVKETTVGIVQLKATFSRIECRKSRSYALCLLKLNGASGSADSLGMDFEDRFLTSEDRHLLEQFKTHAAAHDRMLSRTSVSH